MSNEYQDPRKATSIFIRESLVEIKADLKNTLDKVSDHHAVLFGKNGAPGLDKKVDRLEQSEGQRKTWGAVIGTSTVGLVANAIWERIKG